MQTFLLFFATNIAMMTTDKLDIHLHVEKNGKSDGKVFICWMNNMDEKEANKLSDKKMYEIDKI